MSPCLRLALLASAIAGFIACSSTTEDPAPLESNADETPKNPKKDKVDGAAAPIADAGTDASAFDLGDAPGPPRVDVASSGAYGTHEFDVPANAYWVNSGLYLSAGQTADVKVTGTWDTVVAGVGPEGGPVAHRGCKEGALVARSDLQYEDKKLYCTGASATITALRDGVIFFGSLVDTDLGADSYERRSAFKGSLHVTLTSTGRTAPWVSASNASSFPFAVAKSQGGGQMEIVGKHVSVMTTVAQAEADKDGIADALAFLDAVYDSHHAHRGIQPFNGHRIRFITDPAIDGLGFMLAGNPIRMSPDVFTGGDGREHLLRSGESRFGVWGFAHEMGHTFATAPATNWWYQVGNFLEAWPNVFSTHTLRKLGRPTSDWGASDATYPSAKICPTRATQLASGTYDTLTANPQLTLCFLLEFEETYGDSFFPSFFALLNAVPGGKVPYSADGKATWGWLRDRFSDVAKTDTTPIFTKWKIPLPTP